MYLSAPPQHPSLIQDCAQAKQSVNEKLIISSRTMSDFNPNPYRGEAAIPHVNEEFFKIYFVGAQVFSHP